MYNKLKTILTLSILWFIAPNWVLAQSIKGQVSDERGNLLAFVNVVSLPSQKGTMTDINGRFNINFEATDSVLAFTYVGYEQQRIRLKASITEKPLSVVLKQMAFSLAEVVINAGENPAHIIIRKVTANADRHNPNMLESYKYNSYNKFVFTLDSNITYFSKTETKPKKKSKQEAETTTVDSTNDEIRALVEKQHLFITETVTERTFKAPLKSNEQIIASKVSGFQSPTFILLASQLQSFSFYNDYIALLELEYLNPIAHGSLSRYHFRLEDTTYVGADSIFHISFRPRPEKNFTGLKGILYINSNGWAIQNVIAEPAELANDGMQIKIQQQYEQHGGRWFPTQLYTDLYLKLSGFDNWQIKGNGTSYLNNIQINVPISRREIAFNGIAIDGKAAGRPDDYWNKVRYEPLSEQDLETYRVLDSLGNAHKFDQRLLLLQTLTTGRLPLGKVNLVLEHLFNYSQYEGFRLGMGVETNDKVSRWWGVGGYAAYGFRDKAAKFGGAAWVNLDKNKQQQIEFSISRDLIENGAVPFVFDKAGKAADLIRRTYLPFFDWSEKQQLSYRFRGINGWSGQLSAFQEQRIETPGNFSGVAFPNVFHESAPIPYNWSHQGMHLSLKYARGEQYLKTNSNMMVLSPADRWIYWVNLSRGQIDATHANQTYSRFEVKALRTFTWRHLGKSTIQLMGGHINANLPATLLFFANANTTNQGGLYVPFAFQTVHAQTMLANTFVHGFFIHDFGHLLFKKPKFKPNFLWLFNAGFGNLTQQQAYKREGEWPIDSYSAGLYETGIIVDNLIQSAFSSFGIGGFTRLGPLSSAKVSDNLFFKFSLSTRIAR